VSSTHNRDRNNALGHKQQQPVVPGKGQSKASWVFQQEVSSAVFTVNFYIHYYS